MRPSIPGWMRVQIAEFFKVFLFLPLQFFNFGEMPLQFSYSEICHYNSSYIRILPFYTSFTCLGPLSDRICVRIFRMDENTTAALLPPLNDVRAPLVRFFNLCFQKEAMDGAPAYADLELRTIRGRAWRLYGTIVTGRTRRCASRRLRQASCWVSSSNREEINGIS